MSAEKGKPKKKEAAAEGKSEVYQKEVKRKLVKAAKKGGMKEAPPELLIAMKEERLEDVARMIKETEALKRSYANVEEKQTLFHAAIRTSSLPLVLSLISLGVSTCDVDLQFRNALHHLASTKNPSQALIDAVVAIPGLNLSEQDASGATPLHSAIIEDNPLLSQTLINTPAVSLNAADATGLTPLHCACLKNQEDIVERLLEKGADVGAKDRKGNTALHYTCGLGYLTIGKKLLAKGADVMAVNGKGETPLHRAVKKKEEIIASWLVNNGADVMIRYEKRLYEDRHKIQRRKYLREACQHSKAESGKEEKKKRTSGKKSSIRRNSSGSRINSDDPVEIIATEEDEDDVEASDGENLPDDPEGMLTLKDKLDTYGFLIGSDKSNQLFAAEAASTTFEGDKKPKNESKPKRKPKPSSDNAEDIDDMSTRDSIDLSDITAHLGPSADALHEREKSQQKLIKKWVKITRLYNLKKSDAAVYKAYPADKIRKMVYKGIPNHVRAGVWRFLGATMDAKLSNPVLYEQLSNQPISRKISHQLDIDINRTNRSHFLFKERYGQGQISLFSILRAYSIHDPVVSYCQGMSDLTALMMQYLEEEEAFWLLVRFMQNSNFNMACRFQDDFMGLKRAWYVHDKLLAIYLPQLHAHLSAGNVEPAHYTIKWYLKCFLDALSFDCVLRVWDVLLLEGSDILYSFVLTLLKYHEQAILALDEGDLLMFLPSLKGPPSHISVDSWLKDVRKNPIKTKQIRSFEAEFDAAWPSMVAAATAEAERKQQEWQRRRDLQSKATPSPAPAKSPSSHSIPSKNNSPSNDANSEVSHIQPAEEKLHSLPNENGIVHSVSNSSVADLPSSKSKRRSKVIVQDASASDALANNEEKPKKRNRGKSSRRTTEEPVEV